MKRNAVLGLLVGAVFAGAIAVSATSANKTAPPTRIEGHGKVTRFSDATAQPREDSKIVVDLTTGGPPDQINPGLEKVARFVNIYSQAGKQPARARICVVLHGEATAVSLNDAAYASAFKTEANPNLRLLKTLREAGVEFQVCGQVLTNKGYKLEQTTTNVQVAVSALTVLVNRQQDGYAYIPLLK